MSRHLGRISRAGLFSVRLRLTVLYGALFLVSSTALLTITYALVAHFPVKVEGYVNLRPGGTAGPGLTSLPPLASSAAQQRSADLHHLLAESAIALAVMAVVSIGLGWLVAGRVLRPLSTITAAAQRISASNLHQRLALTGPADELKELGDTFDALLARLDRSFDSHRQFVANASHELRTPLTLGRALLEAALTDPDPTPDAWRTTCERVLAANEHQERLIEALLTLARGEAGLDRWQPFDLAEVTGRVLGTRRTDTERRGIQLTATLDPAPISGDPRLVERLVANLADNALRHNSSTGRVDVRTESSPEHTVLSVANSGPVIPAGEVDRLFQPFQRLSNERHHHDGGLGLGLSIVQAIATAHNAQVEARPQPGGGLEVAVTFPLTPAVGVAVADTDQDSPSHQPVTAAL